MCQREECIRKWVTTIAIAGLGVALVGMMILDDVNRRAVTPDSITWRLVMPPDEPKFSVPTTYVVSIDGKVVGYLRGYSYTLDGASSGWGSATLDVRVVDGNALVGVGQEIMGAEAAVAEPVQEESEPRERSPVEVRTSKLEMED